MSERAAEAPPSEAPSRGTLLALTGGAGAVVFALLLVLVQTAWRPLASLDDGVEQRLNDGVAGHPLVIDVLRVLTAMADPLTTTLAFVALGLAVALRREWRVLLWVALTGAGLAVIIPLVKGWVGRARPTVDVPVVIAPASDAFPSGHAMNATVLSVTAAVVAAAWVAPRLRPLVAAVAGVVVVVVGSTRLALGVHYPSDVLSGYALGLVWLATTTALLRPRLSRPRSSGSVEPDYEQPDDAPAVRARDADSGGAS